MKIWIIFITLSVAAHFGLGAPFYFGKETAKPKPHVKVKIKIAAKKKEVVEPKVTPEPEVKPTPKPKPKPKSKPKPAPKSERQPATPPKKNAQPVQGVSKKSLSKGASGISVPVGNTLMIEDRGIRLKVEEVESLAQDLSTEAKIIASSVIQPEYTNDALDAGIEGNYKVDVYVDESGIVTDAELAKKIGYGMDRRVIASAMKTKYEPRRDRTGKPLAGWTSIVFRLQIE